MKLPQEGSAMTPGGLHKAPRAQARQRPRWITPVVIVGVVAATDPSSKQLAWRLFLDGLVGRHE
eukprot:7866951-Pyramimonas_sp.AAC.1